MSLAKISSYSVGSVSLTLSLRGQSHLTMLDFAHAIAVFTQGAAEVYCHSAKNCGSGQQQAICSPAAVSHTQSLATNFVKSEIDDHTYMLLVPKPAIVCLN